MHPEFRNILRFKPAIKQRIKLAQFLLGKKSSGLFAIQSLGELQLQSQLLNFLKYRLHQRF